METAGDPVGQAIDRLVLGPRCPVCDGTNWTTHEGNVTFLSDFFRGRSGWEPTGDAPRPILEFSCTGCGFLRLHLLLDPPSESAPDP